MNDFNGGTRANPKIEMTDEIREFLTANYKEMKNADMGQHFNVSPFKIYCWLKELNLKKPAPVRKGKQVETEFFTWDKSIVTI